MLEKLAAFGDKKGFFLSKPLGELDKSCCTQARTSVIDFDNAKEVISRSCPINQPKSADALKILPHSNRLDFIELKGFEKFIHHNKDKNNEESFRETTCQQIEKFSLPEKIRDSLFILNIILKHKEFSCAKDDIDKYQNVIKNYIIVTDLDISKNPLEDRMLTLAFLSEPTDNLNKYNLE